MSRDKLNSLYLHLQKTRVHQNRQGTGLKWEAPILKAILPFDYVTNLRSGDSRYMASNAHKHEISGCRHNN